jgi:hypothetical protein
MTMATGGTTTARGSRATGGTTMATGGMTTGGTTMARASKTFIFIQGKIDRSSHYDVIKMRSLSKRQFCMKEELMFTNIPPKHNDVDMIIMMIKLITIMK